MFSLWQKKNSVKSIARQLPVRLVESYTRQEYYSVEQVTEVFSQVFSHDHNQAYAYAMFCSQADFDGLQTGLSYAEMRADVGKHCFHDWPRFNFESLLAYARSTYSDGGFIAGGEGGGADGGCG
ncbi:DUF6559 family protein [Pseudoalteromonas rubra]|uniref:Uncharacterized protein n=1 Tax=Pseudoalteromonas rubra TaxID=43658 RepID=A0A0U3ICE9_9GAMM|nr:DUF6559 family protein [Pseudoalteromonas rubra]ALU45472.1 hypothetical protein AT705_21245 [Pseudoalteromonas rubra]